MAYRPVLGEGDPGGPDSPNSGRIKINANDLELYQRKLNAADLVSDYVVDGLLPTVPSPPSRTMETPAGTAYVGGNRIEQAAELATYAKASDTYVDLDSAEAYAYSAVANGAAAPALAASSVRLFRAATDADVAQVETVTVTTVANSTIYTVTINGVGVSYTSDASATAGEIALGLVAAINASTDPNVSVVTAATSAVAADTTASLTITADVAGSPFTLTVGANLSRSTTTANNTSKITTVTDLRQTSPQLQDAPKNPLRHLSADPATPADGESWVRSDLTPPDIRTRKGGVTYRVAMVAA